MADQLPGLSNSVPVPGSNRTNSGGADRRRGCKGGNSKDPNCGLLQNSPPPIRRQRSRSAQPRDQRGGTGPAIRPAVTEMPKLWEEPRKYEETGDGKAAESSKARRRVAKLQVGEPTRFATPSTDRIEDQSHGDRL